MVTKQPSPADYDITVESQEIHWRVADGRLMVYGDVFTNLEKVFIQQGARSINGGNLNMEFNRGEYHYTKNLDFMCSDDSIPREVKKFVQEVVHVENMLMLGPIKQVKLFKYYNIYPCRVGQCKPTLKPTLKPTPKPVEIEVDFGDMKFDVINPSNPKPDEVDVQIEFADMHIQYATPGLCARYYGCIGTNHGLVFVDQPYREGSLKLNLNFQNHVHHKVYDRVYCIKDVNDDVKDFVKEVVQVHRETKLPVVIESNNVRCTGPIYRGHTFVGNMVTNFGVVNVSQFTRGEYLTLEITLKRGIFKMQFSPVTIIKDVELAVLKFVGDAVVEGVLGR